METISRANHTVNVTPSLSQLRSLNVCFALIQRLTRTEVVTPKGRAPAAETPWTRLSFTPKVERSPQEISAWRAENEISLQGKVECPDPILTFDEAPFSSMLRSFCVTQAF